MRNTIVSPRFEGEPYKGQDVVHQGVRIPLRGWAPEVLLKMFSRNAQRSIKTLDVAFEYVDMKDEHLPVLRKMWFDEHDPTFPDSMVEHTGVVAIRKDTREVWGGAIWAYAGSGLFLHQLVAGTEGKAFNVPTKLIWQSVLKYKREDVFALDIGVSYNPKRYAFFKNFAVETYPIILKKPELVPVIRLTPFRILANTGAEGQTSFEGDVTFFPRGYYALVAALKLSGVKEGDLVSIIKTFHGPYVSGCVTKAIKAVGAAVLIGRVEPDQTKAVIALHEFGIPVYQQDDIDHLGKAQVLHIPVIEDCAWRSCRMWEWTKFAVFSLPKLYPLNYGGLLAGVKLTDDQMWELGALDVVKRDRLAREMAFGDGAQVRVRNWLMYNDMVKKDGMTPDDCFDYEKAISKGQWKPTVYLQRFKDDAEADAIVERLEQFGIQAGRYWGEPVVYLPVHQNMTEAEVEYMFAVVRGYFNLCRDYQGKVKQEV